jgi:ABC-type Fe3+/spermidine/putrescine transport system ATPase subunit
VKVGGTTLAVALGDCALKGECKVIIRPERIRLERPGPASDGENRVRGRVERSIYIGSAFQLIVRLHIGCTVEVEVQNNGYQTDFEAGSEVSALLPPEALRVLRDGGESWSESRTEAGTARESSAPAMPGQQKRGKGSTRVRQARA